MNGKFATMTSCLLVLFISMSWMPARALAQCELIKLTAEGDAGLGDEFGTSVAISGAYAVIGAPLHDGHGAAFVFRRNGPAWSLEQKLTASNAAPGDRFGQSVAIDGDYLVVGARAGDAAIDKTNTGTSYVFFNDGSGLWIQQGEPLVAEAPMTNDRFGNSVAISGDVIAVGTPRYDEVGNSAGAVFVFRRTGAVWTREQTLFASDAFASDEFGTAGAIAGDAVVAGSPGSDPGNQAQAGAAYLFRYNQADATWREEQKFFASDASQHAAFGRAVSISGSAVLVGAIQADGAVGVTGAAYLYRLAGNEWREEHKFFAQDGRNLASFGSAVALGGDVAVVGAARDFDGATPAQALIGAVYFFARQEDTWVALGKRRAVDQQPYSELGCSVTTDGIVVLTGACTDDHGGAVDDDFGAAYVHVVHGSWNENGSCLPCIDTSGCEDATDCTTPECDLDLRVCTILVQPGTCLIDGECWEDGATRPGMECEHCDSTNPRDWTFNPEGSPCLGNGLFCSGEATCDGAGHCRSPGNPCDLPLYCDDTLDSCVECLVDTHCSDHNECTVDVCEPTGECANPNRPSGSMCGDQSESPCDSPDTCDGTGNCVVNHGPDGLACPDDTLVCTNDVCEEGICTHHPFDGYCAIDGLCLTERAINPRNECEWCDPSHDAIWWSPVAEETPCAEDQFPCTTASCLEGTCTHDPIDGFCLIDGTCYEAGAINPQNSCQACIATVSPLNWSLRPDGTVCLENRDECTKAEICYAGICVGIWVPNGTPCTTDNNACTTYDACREGTCVGVALPNGTPCPGGSGECNGAESCFNGGCTCQGLIYVDDDAPQGGDGMSWTSAFRYLQDALAVADRHVIRVAAGTYKPDHDDLGARTPGDQFATFHLKNGVKIRGGYAGLSAPENPDFRDLTAYESILTGDLLGNDQPTSDVALWLDPTRQDNSRHVVTGSGTDATAILDGFTITGGTAVGAWPYGFGGAIYNYIGSPTISSCLLIRNAALLGGAMANDSFSSPSVTKCIFIGNASQRGGGINNFSESSPTVTDCTFTNNTAFEGGAVYNEEGCSPTLTNCLVTGNRAGWSGGGVFNYGGSHPRLLNTTLVGNRAAHFGGALASESDSYARLTNCILWANSASGYDQRAYDTFFVHSSCIQDDDPDDHRIYPGLGNIDDDPQFIDSGHWDDMGTPDLDADDIWIDGDYHLRSISPCINSGNTEALPVPITEDFEGDARIQQCRVDIGADETPYIGLDCNLNGLSDACDIVMGDSLDCNRNMVPDECEPGGLLDCNANAVADLCDIFEATSADCNKNMVPDECESVPIVIYVDQHANGYNNGANWTDAYRELYDALSHARACAVGAGPSIWVAEGHYLPDVRGLGNKRQASFSLVDRVTIYGGFPRGGGDGSFSARNPREHDTVASGDVGISGDPSDNCYHVFSHPGVVLDSSTALDGFTISGGNARGYRYADQRGGGVYNEGQCHPTFMRCVFAGNGAVFGGAVYIAGPANVRIVQCAFRSNSATQGGAVFNAREGTIDIVQSRFSRNRASLSGGAISSSHGASCSVTNSTFEDNNVEYYYGGAVRASSGIDSFVNCRFVRNAARYGGALSIPSASIVVATNCTFFANSAESGRAVFAEGDIAGGGLRAANEGITPLGGVTAFKGDVIFPGGVWIDNSIFWDDGNEIAIQGTAAVSVTYSAVQDFDSSDVFIYPGVGNIDDNPLFVDPNGSDNIPGTEDDDLRLLPGSPCIDAGDNSAVSPDVADLDGDGNSSEPIPFDIDGNPRFVDDPSTVDTGHGTSPIVDMGAFEFVEVCGNGIVELLEDCDDAGMSAACDADCTWAECGDGLLNEVAGEACDGTDAAACAGRSCRRNCTCVPLTCGNGVREPGEACDGLDAVQCGAFGCRTDCTCRLPKPAAPSRLDKPTRAR